MPEKPDCTSEPDLTLEELQAAVSRMKSKKACDDAGVVAELLKFAPEEFLAELLVLYNQTLRDGIVPETWRATTFIMLAKKTKANCTADFRPVVCHRKRN